jgi:HAD superfamily hydrolase (TIGR01509 family)
MFFKAAIFDLDGTITEPFLDFDQIRKEIGLVPDGTTILEAMVDMTEDEKCRAISIDEAHETRAMENSTLNPGAKETLQWLASNRIPIGILTRNKKSNAVAVARKHGLEFDAIVDRDDGPVKPDCFGIVKLCEGFGIKPSEAIVIGDYLHDILAAKAAGSVAVLLKNHKNADQFAKYADYVINRIDELINIFKNHDPGDRNA